MEERRYFLLVYDRDDSRLVEEPREYPFGERDRALSDRAARILAERPHPSIEVVLLGATSVEDLKRTHARYFKSTDELVEVGETKSRSIAAKQV